MRRSLVHSGGDDTPLPFRMLQSRGRFSDRLGFRFRDGRMKSLPYSYLLETEFNPDVGIILDYAGHRVTLYGRNLKDLYLSIEDEEVGEITEQHTNDPSIRERDTFIESIGWEKI
jgi:hypothetical protein